MAALDCNHNHGIATGSIPLVISQNPRAALVAQGWTVSEDRGSLELQRYDPIPPNSISILRGLPAPFSLVLRGAITDISALRDLKHIKYLNLSITRVGDVSALRGLKNLTQLDVSSTKVTDVSALRGLNKLMNSPSGSRT